MLANTLLAVSILAAATPTPGGSGGTIPASSCSTGPVQCCQTSGSASDPAISTVLAGLGIVVQDVNALVGLTCSAVSVVGVGSGATCDASALCCSENSFGGLASIGCVPVDLSS
ncbi:fungal hydrophobin [Epithele typhae]|uniref:fungal hydrophobin n=1 Tax=Epithele typhae TaxID=378194 RepID=UPI002008CF2B|nr:fungal hydrophobin [Epithele typhae]KAH9940186.1 fungal hydrophobin [Epithele typhae]